MAKKKFRKAQDASPGWSRNGRFYRSHVLTEKGDENRHGRKEGFTGGEKIQSDLCRGLWLSRERY